MKLLLSILALSGALLTATDVRAHEPTQLLESRAVSLSCGATKPLVLLAQARRTKSAADEASDAAVYAADASNEEKRHADERTQFLTSVAVPLSKAETKQYDALVQAERAASAARITSFDSLDAADEAFEKAAPAKAAPLKRKRDALRKSYDSSFQKELAAGEAIMKFRAAKHARMPRELRQALAAGATSVSVRRHLIGALGEPTLVHLWTTSRRKGALNAPQIRRDFKTVPLRLDVWQKAARGKRTRRWQRVVSAPVMLGSISSGEGSTSSDEGNVGVYYLRPATKQSPVLVLFSQAWKASIYTVLTFPGGFGNPAVVQEFRANPYAKEVYEFGVDGRGILTMLIKNAGWMRQPGDPVLAWNGRKFAPRIVPK